MQDKEAYAGARTLATVEHLGETFRLVRRRINGKPWRKCITLLHGDVCVSYSHPRVTDMSDPVECAAYYKDQLSRTYTSRDALLLALNAHTQRAA